MPQDPTTQDNFPPNQDYEIIVRFIQVGQRWMAIQDARHGLYSALCDTQREAMESLQARIKARDEAIGAWLGVPGIDD